jgi:hypothetical protein
MFSLANARRLCDQRAANRIEDFVNEVQSLSTEVYNAPDMASMFLDPPNGVIPSKVTIDGSEITGASVPMMIPDEIVTTDDGRVVDGHSRAIADSAYKMTNKLFFMDNIEYENDQRYTSIEPAEIVGKQVVLVFNTVNRQLALYHSKSLDGFTVKGSTLKDWSPSRSESKTLRWPETQLGHVRDADDPVNWFDAIRAKPKALTGRINKHCILLRAW